MSKKFLRKWFRHVVFVGLGLIVLTGCEQFSSDGNSFQTRIPPEKTRRIETLELQEAVDEGRAAEDVNDVDEVPLKELELTLEECRALTLENNLDLKVQLINPAIAAEQVSEQEAQFEAVFYSNLTFSKTDTPRASFLDDISGSQVDYTGTGLGVQIPLRTGGTVSFDLADSRVKTGFRLVSRCFEVPASALIPMASVSPSMSSK